MTPGDGAAADVDGFSDAIGDGWLTNWFILKDFGAGGGLATEILGNWDNCFPLFICSICKYKELSRAYMQLVQLLIEALFYASILQLQTFIQLILHVFNK